MSKHHVHAALAAVLTIGIALVCSTVAEADEPPLEPAAPSATAAVKSRLDEAERLVESRDLVAAVTEAQAAVELARSTGDAAGEALGWKSKARLLERQDRFEDALTAWRQARGAWQRVGDGPGQIEAIGGEARLRLRDPAFDASPLVAGAIALMENEVQRPIAAAESLSKAGDSLRLGGLPNEAKAFCESAVKRLETLQPDSLPLATALLRLGALARVRGDLEGARGYLERSLAIQQAKAPGSLAAATSLNVLGSVANDQGDLEKARGYQESALAIQEAKAPGSLEVAFSLNNLGGVARNQGDLETAHQYFERALAIREAKAPGSLEVAATLNNLGSLTLDQGDLEKARGYHERALAIQEAKAPGSIEVAFSLNNLGIVARRQGDLERARGYHERALAIREAKAPGSLAVAASLNNLGNVALDQGDLEGARGYFERALAIREAKAPGSLTVAASLNNLGNVALDQGDLESARGYFERALAIKESTAPGSLDVATGLDNLGAVVLSQGDFEGARGYLERALAIREAKAPESLDVASSLINVGTVAYEMDDLASARRSYERALAIQEMTAPGSLDVAMSLNSLGNVAADERDLEGARGYLERALAIQEKKAPDSLVVAASLNNLALVARDQGDLEQARAYLERALAIDEVKAPGSLAYAKSLNSVGTVYRMMGGIERARESFAKSWAIVRRQGALLTGDVAKQAFGQSYSGYASILLRTQLESGDAASALLTLEESRAQGLLQMLALRGMQGRLQDPSLWAAYRKAETGFQSAAGRLADASVALDQAAAAVESARSTTNPSPELAQQEKALTEAASGREAAFAEYTRLRLEMESRLADVRKTVPALRDDPVSLDEARKVLPPGSVWLAFSVSEDDTVVFLVPSAPSSSITAYVIPTKEADLEAKVTALLDKIMTALPPAPALRQRREHELLSAGRALYELLFPETVRPAIEEADRLMISPDGVLWELPFSALTSGRDDNPLWLGLAKSISYQQSLSAYVREGSLEREKGEGVLIVGNPAFSPKVTIARAQAGEAPKQSTAKANPPVKVEAARTIDWSRGERAHFALNGKPPSSLPGTEREARELARLYGAQPLLGVEATESAVRHKLPGAAVVHLATHGYFNPTMPMASGVLLALPVKEPENGATGDDGMLQAYEFSGDLRVKADLVVLSACETGRGTKVHGEGLVGLTRSLQMAGARSVVATRWRINDRVSGDLMVSFHKKWRSGMAGDEALRDAMREVQGKNSTRDPYYWAAFFLTGEPQPRGSQQNER